MSSMEALYHSIKHTNTREHIESAIKTYAESFPNHDLDARAAIFDEDASFSDPANAPAFEGKKTIIQFWQGLKAAPFRMEPEVHQIIVCGDSALLDFTMHMKAEGGSRSLHVRDIFEFNDEGKIQTLTAFWDPACLYES